MTVYLFLLLLFLLCQDYMNTCYVEGGNEMTQFQLAFDFLSCSPWVGFFTIVAFINIIWISALCVCHIYQVTIKYIFGFFFQFYIIEYLTNNQNNISKAVFLSLTTNERMNVKRYKHFYDKSGKYNNPFK